MEHALQNRLVGRILVLTIATLVACGPKTKVKAVKATRTRVESTVTTVSSGTVYADLQAALGFNTNGRVTAIHAKLGDRVTKGTVLAELDNADLRAGFDTAESEWKRSEQLFKEGLIARAALDEARRAFEAARSALERSVIRAPFDGLVTEVNLHLGELAQNNTKTPLRLVDTKPRIVKGEIDEIDLAKVKEGAPARLKILAVRTEPFKGVVTRVVPFIGTSREQDRSSPIELAFGEPTENVPVGATTDIEIVVDSKDGALAVPSRSIFGSGAKRHVFAVDGAKSVRREVKLGVGNYERTEILEGLKEGDLVIVPGEDTELADGKRVEAEVAPWP